MMLFELLERVNESCIVDIYAACTNEKIASYDGKDDVPDRLQDDEVTDIFVEMGNHLCIEIDIEPDSDYEEV